MLGGAVVVCARLLRPGFLRTLESFKAASTIYQIHSTCRLVICGTHFIWQFTYRISRELLVHVTKRVCGAICDVIRSVRPDGPGNLAAISQPCSSIFTLPTDGPPHRFSMAGLEQADAALKNKSSRCVLCNCITDRPSSPQYSSHPPLFPHLSPILRIWTCR
jgi:hypothetical protein